MKPVSFAWKKSFPGFAAEFKFQKSLVTFQDLDDLLREIPIEIGIYPSPLLRH